MKDKPAGWHWFEENTTDKPDDDGKGAENRELAVAAARCLSGSEGNRLMKHLRHMTRERLLAADCSNRVLRHLEGQRFVVAYLETLIQRGLRSN